MRPPHLASKEELWRRSLRGCIWAVTRRTLRQSLAHASDCGVAAHGILPSGWADLAGGEEELEGDIEEDDETGAIATDDDGITQLPYSDHCSFLELVQFLSWLPAVPVTFISQLPTPGRAFAYDGQEGLKSLLQHSGVPSIRYCPASEKPAAFPNKRRRADTLEATRSTAGCSSNC